MGHPSLSIVFGWLVYLPCKVWKLVVRRGFYCSSLSTSVRIVLTKFLHFTKNFRRDGSITHTYSETYFIISSPLGIISTLSTKQESQTVNLERSIMNFPDSPHRRLPTLRFRHILLGDSFSKSLDVFAVVVLGRHIVKVLTTNRPVNKSILLVPLSTDGVRNGGNLAYRGRPSTDQ